jgi:hypothetical protein
VSQACSTNGEVRIVNRLLVEDAEERDPLGALGINRRTILKRI